MSDEVTRRGVAWKQVQASSMSENGHKLYKAYVKAFKDAQSAAETLKDAVTSEWNKKYPDGIEGRAIAFNAIGGVLNYAWVEKGKQKKAKREFDEDAGDNVFARPR